MGIETALIATAALGAASTLSQAATANNQAKFQAAEMNRQAEETAIAADQEETARRENLNSTLATIDAIRGGRGNVFSSPTSQAIIGGERRMAMRDIRVGRFNAASQGDALRRSASMTKRSGRAALTSGFLSAGAQGMSLLSTYRQLPQAKRGGG